MTILLLISVAWPSQMDRNRGVGMFTMPHAETVVRLRVDEATIDVAQVTILEVLRGNPDVPRQTTLRNAFVQNAWLLLEHGAFRAGQELFVGLVPDPWSGPLPPPGETQREAPSESTWRAWPVIEPEKFAEYAWVEKYYLLIDEWAIYDRAVQEYHPDAQGVFGSRTDKPWTKRCVFEREFVANALASDSLPFDPRQYMDRRKHRVLKRLRRFWSTVDIALLEGSGARDRIPVDTDLRDWAENMKNAGKCGLKQRWW